MQLTISSAIIARRKGAAERSSGTGDDRDVFPSPRPRLDDRQKVNATTSMAHSRDQNPVWATLTERLTRDPRGQHFAKSQRGQRKSSIHITSSSRERVKRFLLHTRTHTLFLSSSLSRTHTRSLCPFASVRAHSQAAQADHSNQTGSLPSSTARDLPFIRWIQACIENDQPQTWQELSRRPLRL